MVVVAQLAAQELRMQFGRCRMAGWQAAAVAVGNFGECDLPVRRGSSVLTAFFVASCSAGPGPLVQHFWPAAPDVDTAASATYRNELQLKT